MEKLAYNGEEAVPQIIGTLTEGAVLGDVTWWRWSLGSFRVGPDGYLVVWMEDYEGF